MKSNLASFIAAFIFALGLGISGMTQPQKVIGFLDFFGNWDPSLAFVMIGAIFVHLLAYRLKTKIAHPIFSPEWFLPTDKDLSPSLLVGAAIFGMGWGMGGFCPGPALVSLASLHRQIFIFVGAMVVAMLSFRFVKRLRNS